MTDSANGARRAVRAVRSGVGWAARRAAPRSMAVMADVATARDEFGDVGRHLRELTERVAVLEARVADLIEDIDETRADGRRVAELYDLVIERLSAPPEPSRESAPVQD